METIQERCEAYTPEEPSAAKIATYEKNGLSVPLFTRILLSCRENPMETERKLKEHLEEVELRAKARIHLSTEIPTRSPDYTADFSKHYNHDAKQDFVRRRALLKTARAPPRPGSRSPLFSSRAMVSARRRRR